MKDLQQKVAEDLVLLKDALFRLELYMTGHSLDHALKIFGYEAHLQVETDPKMRSKLKKKLNSLVTTYE